MAETTHSALSEVSDEETLHQIDKGTQDSDPDTLQSISQVSVASTAASNSEIIPPNTGPDRILDDSSENQTCYLSNVELGSQKPEKLQSWNQDSYPEPEKTHDLNYQMTNNASAEVFPNSNLYGDYQTQNVTVPFSNYPLQRMPTSNFPMQDMPSRMSTSNFHMQGMPTSNFPMQGMPTSNFPMQSMPTSNFSMQGTPTMPNVMYNWNQWGYPCPPQRFQNIQAQQAQYMNMYQFVNQMGPCGQRPGLSQSVYAAPDQFGMHTLDNQLQMQQADVEHVHQQTSQMLQQSVCTEKRREDHSQDNTELQRRPRQSVPPVPKPRQSLSKDKKPTKSGESQEGRVASGSITPQPRKTITKESMRFSSSIAGSQNIQKELQRDITKLSTSQQKHKALPLSSTEPKFKSQDSQKTKVKSKERAGCEKPYFRASTANEEMTSAQMEQKQTEKEPYEDFLVFVKNINPDTSAENLEMYLEGGAGGNAEVKENTTIYSRDHTEALVTFTGRPEMAHLMKRCSQKRLDDTILTVCGVPSPNCIAVSSQEDVGSDDALLLYFESSKIGGELAKEVVQESSDGSCKIIDFKSTEAVKRLTNGEKHHVISGVSLNVSPYYKCEIGEIWDTSIHFIQLPEPLTIPLPKIKTEFLSRKCCTELTEEFSKVYADLGFDDTGIQIRCMLTQRTVNCRALAKTWTVKVQNCFDKYIQQLYEQKLTVKDHIWEGMTDLLNKGNLDGDGLLIEEQTGQHQIFLFGQPDEVKKTVSLLNDEMEKLDRTVRRTSKVIKFKDTARLRLLQTIHTIENIKKDFTDLKIKCSNHELYLEGVPEDIDQAELSLLEMNNELVCENIRHQFTTALTDLLRQLEKHNGIIEIIRTELEAKNITAEFEINKHECFIVVPSGRNCEEAKDVIFGLLEENEIQLENESLTLVEKQQENDLNKDGTETFNGIAEKFENTVDVRFHKAKHVVHIAGLKEDVRKAKEQLEKFFEENTVKSECLPVDQLTQSFITRHSLKAIEETERQLSDHKVSIKLGDRNVCVEGTKKGLQLARQEMKNLFSNICHKEHTFQKVGVAEAANNVVPLLDQIETKTRCIIERPCLTETAYSACEQYIPENIEDPMWYNKDYIPDDEVRTSSFEEPRDFKAKNGLKISLVKGEIGKQEGSVIVCLTSPTLNLDKGFSGKSLLREGGNTLLDECKEIIASRESIKQGEIVKIGGGRIECKYIYLTTLPRWTDDGSSLQMIESIVRDCLLEASKDQSFSLVLCSLGTGGLKYPPEEVAAVMYDKVIEFDTENRDTMLQEVKIVIHHKDTSTIKAFQEEEEHRKLGSERITYDVQFTNVKVDLVIEQLVTQKVDCVLCTTNKELRLEKSRVCKTLLNAGGSSLQDECKSKYSDNLKDGDVAEISAGNLHCKSVYLTHLPSFSEQSDQSEKLIQNAVKTALELAQTQKYTSLACIALGTGYLNYPRSFAAKCMYSAIKEFAEANPSSSLQQIKIVLHAKDRETIEAFRAHVKRTKGAKGVTTRKDRNLEADKQVKSTVTGSGCITFEDGCQIRHITLKVLKGDVVQQDTEGIVNFVGRAFEFRGGLALALNNKCPGLKEESQSKVDLLKSKGIVITSRSQHGGDLRAEHIIHIPYQKTLDKWKLKLVQCLKEAEEKKLKSLSIPYFGVGNAQHSFEPDDITGCIFTAIDEFSKAKTHIRLKELKLVIFHKDQLTTKSIIKTLHKQVQDAEKATQQKPGLLSRITELPGKMFASIFGSGKENTKRAKEEISSITLNIHSDDEKNIDSCIKEIELHLDEEYVDYTLSDYIDLIKTLTKDEIAKLEVIDCVVDMNIDQTAGIIKINGTKKFVHQAQSILHEQLKTYERQRQKNEEANTLHQQIQWQFEEVLEDRTELVTYDKMTNIKIENAYKNKEPSIELVDYANNAVYVVDFSTYEEYIKGERESSAINVVRKDILKSEKVALPKEWVDMKEDENIRIVNLMVSDSVYQQIEQRFVKEVLNGKYNNTPTSVKSAKVTKIDRIQNKALYQQYEAKKQAMMKETPNPSPKFPIERTLWHGTGANVVSSIEVHGFNRSYAGQDPAKGRPWYGDGVYFAADASYAARSWLSGANAAGDGTTKGYVFLVNALTGEYLKGQKQMRFLPPKDPNGDTTIVYDSAVNDVNDPFEFVIFHDAQAYPDYLITFIS